MVQYVIKSKGNIEEWSIVELQGELEIRNGGQNFDGKYFGDLHYKNRKPVLILGINRICKNIELTFCRSSYIEWRNKEVR